MSVPGQHRSTRRSSGTEYQPHGRFDQHSALGNPPLPGRQPSPPNGAWAGQPAYGDSHNNGDANPQDPSGMSGPSGPSTPSNPAQPQPRRSRASNPSGPGASPSPAHDLAPRLGSSTAHGGSLRWGFLHPEGAVASPRIGGLSGVGGLSVGGLSGVGAPNGPWPGYGAPDGTAPRLGKPGSGRMGASGLQMMPEGGVSSRMYGGQSGLSGPTDHSGQFLPVELPSQAIAGGCTTHDLGQFSKTATGVHDADGVTKPFTEEVVSYKHGDNIILHQWAGGGDLLVNCQSPTPQSFICQYGISSGTMAWTLDVSRTCDKFWFGVTVDKDLDCNDWIADHDAAYMISEEGDIEEKTYENYVPKTVRERPARPAMVQQADAAPRWVRLKPFPPAANIDGIWASIAFVLDMDKGELYMQVSNGGGDTSPKSRLFRGLPKGFMVYPCLSMCNAGQVVFLKYGE